MTTLEELGAKLHAACLRRAELLRGEAELTQRQRHAIAAMLDELARGYTPEGLASFRRKWDILCKHDPEMNWLPQVDD